MSKTGPVKSNKALPERAKGTGYGRAVSSIEQREGERFQEEQSSELAKWQGRKVSKKF